MPQRSGSLGVLQHSHVIHIAGVWHLLQIDPHPWGGPRLHPHHRLFHQVLHVDKATPHVVQVVEWVSFRAWVPKPGVEQHAGGGGGTQHPTPGLGCSEGLRPPTCL